MRSLSKNICLIVCMASATMTSAIAMDLTAAYQAALIFDSDLLAAKASREESAESVPLARSALLPQLSYSMQRNRSDTTTHYLNTNRADTDSGKYNSGSASLNFRQALFRKPAWDALNAAQAQSEASEAGFRREIQNLGQRVISTYLEVLTARENLTLAKNQTITMEAWFTLAEKSFMAGRGTRTDIAEAMSRRDLSRAKESEANMLLVAASRNFEIVSGLDAETIPESDPRLLNPDLMLLVDKDEWLKRIEEFSPEIQSLRKQLEAAQAGVAQAQSGHLPTVDLVAAHQYSMSDSNTSIGTAYTTNYVGVQVNIPLISGGGVMAQARQANAKEERVRQVLESTRRKTLSEANRLYLATHQGIEQVQAFKQAMVSAEQAVLGDKKGIQAGTRTLVDAMDSERRLIEAMRDHAVAVYTLANNRSKFLALADAIDIEAVKALSAWLSAARR